MVQIRSGYYAPAPKKASRHTERLRVRGILADERKFLRRASWGAAVLRPYTAVLEVSVRHAADLEVGAATAIDPDAAAVVAPRCIEHAIRVAALAHQANATVRIDRAGVAAHIVGRARDDLRAGAGSGSPAATTATSADLKVSAATAIDPDAAAIIAPRATEIAWRTAALANQLHAAAGVGRADIAPAVVGSAINVVAVVPAAPIRARDGEVSAAAAINPDAASVDEAPRVIEDAGRVATLLHELHATADVGSTIVAPHVVGRARDDLALRIGRGIW